MGIIKQGILGGFKNKVGSVVGTSWKGRAVMKAMPLSVANPRTAGQVEQRTKFKAATQLGSMLLAGIVKPLNDRFAGNVSGYNSFVKRNVENYDDFSSEWSTVSISKGKMAAPQDYDVNITTVSLTKIEWSTNVFDQYQMPTDRVFVAIIDIKSDAEATSGSEIIGVTRSSGQATIDLSDAKYEGKQLLIVTAFLRNDGTVVSNSAAKMVTIVV